MKINLLRYATLFICLLLSSWAFGQIKLPKLVSDGMVLQRDADVRIWGWASPGEKVTVSFMGASYAAETFNDGKWSVTLPKLKAGGSYEMQITASNNITIKDILIGDVWICSGQSNMEMSMMSLKAKYPEDIAASENKFIRQFVVPRKHIFSKSLEDVSAGSWVNADPNTVLRFTAVGYYFARNLYEKYKVPIGLINATLGGSRTESWMSEDALKPFPTLYEDAIKYKDTTVIIQTEVEDRKRIAVRVVCPSGRGGFVPEKQYAIVLGDDAIDLTGKWKYKLGSKMESLVGSSFIQWKATGLFNGMIAPLLNYTIKGALWYQGESNVGRAEQHRSLFPALIKNWREKWNQGDFPFLFVQLPDFNESQKEPSDGGWARFRETQTASLSVPNTGMAVAIDIGEWNDIHPTNKKDLGYRLSLAAQKAAYGEKDIVYSGPIYQSMKVKGNKITITFTNVGSGLIAKGGGSLKQFAVAGEDKKFVWANAEIKKNTIVVWSDKVANPVAVRYAWADNPEGANLYNREGLPASPFRTDKD